MKKISADLYNKRLDIYGSIELPATAEEISDALEQVRDYKGNNKIATLNHFTDNLNLFCQNEIKPCNVYELNHFAELLSQMDLIEFMRFEGLVKSEFSTKKEPKISDLINLIMNLEQCNVMNVAVANDYDLGKFYVDNDFIDEVNSNTPKWLLDNLNYKKVGKQMRESENGQFVKGGYVVNSTEIKQIYDGKYPKPTPADYVFKLEITKASVGKEFDYQNAVTIKIPTSNENDKNAIKREETSESMFCKFESTLPQLGDIFTLLEDFDSLNELAINIEGMKESDDLTKYKAMLSTIEESELTLEMALEICGYISQFDMEYSLSTPEEYARLKTKDIDFPMKEELLNTSNVYMYGEKLMRNNGVALTDYGMLIPLDGMTLKEYIEHSKSQAKTMTMGGLSQ